jgi:hypothetical protein
MDTPSAVGPTDVSPVQPPPASTASKSASTEAIVAEADKIDPASANRTAEKADPEFQKQWKCIQRHRQGCQGALHKASAGSKQHCRNPAFSLVNRSHMKAHERGGQIFSFIYTVIKGDFWPPPAVRINKWTLVYAEFSSCSFCHSHLSMLCTESRMETTTVGCRWR